MSRGDVNSGAGQFQGQDPLFTFAVVGDSHIRPLDGDLSSPFATNELANGRARYATWLINSLDPDFVVHMGDHVQPVPALPSYDDAAEGVKAIFGKLKAPLHSVPGNHDIGDKSVDWMPAHKVSEEGISRYERHFGRSYASFDRDECHFVVVNTPVINSGLQTEAAQRLWLEEDLAKNAGRRIFLFAHYPPFLSEPDEESHYDNLDEPGRSWLLDLVRLYEVEAVFSGHVHTLFYNRLGPSEFYVLPSITFVRNDFSELFRVEAAEENGRNDLGKFGVYLVKVYPEGHVAQFIRTEGALLGEDEQPAAAAYVAGLHPKESKNPIGVDLRHPWAERVQMPFNGPVDEFHRKTVRNDYPVLALWECGIQIARVPLSDLLDDRIRLRMANLKAVGHRFRVFSFGVPTPQVQQALVEHADLIGVWEVVFPWEQLAAVAAGIRSVRERASLRTHLAKLATSAHDRVKSSRFDHFVIHGFRPDEFDLIERFLATEKGVADGFLFRIDPSESPRRIVQTVRTRAAELGVEASFVVQLAPENEAGARRDDDWIAERVAEATVAVGAAGDVEAYFDTFDDIDRGYFVRHGLYDRRYNPRRAGHVLRHLHRALQAPHKTAGIRLHLAPSSAGAIRVEREESSASLFRMGGRLLALVPSVHRGALHLTVPGGLVRETSGRALCIDLLNGSKMFVPWYGQTSDTGELTVAVSRVGDGETGAPTLVEFFSQT